MLKIIQNIVKKRLGGGDLNQMMLLRDDLRYGPATVAVGGGLIPNSAGPNAFDEGDHCEFLLGEENNALRKLLMDVLEMRGSTSSNGVLK